MAEKIPERSIDETGKIRMEYAPNFIYPSDSIDERAKIWNELWQKINAAIAKEKMDSEHEGIDYACKLMESQEKYLLAQKDAEISALQKENAELKKKVSSK